MREGNSEGDTSQEELVLSDGAADGDTDTEGLDESP